MPLADVASCPTSAIVLADGRRGAGCARPGASTTGWRSPAPRSSGVAARALEIGVEYVKERKAWGVPIGSFQAHRAPPGRHAPPRSTAPGCWPTRPAWAVDEQPERAAELAAMAFAFAYETARDATYRSLHFHGGYGFMMEYDIQLYYRRARGLGQRLRRTRARLPPGGRPPLRTAGRRDERGGRLMDFRLGEKSDAFRAEVEAFLDEQMTPELEEKLYRTGVSNDEDFTKALAERGWLALGWPVEWGGQGRDPLEVMAYARGGAEGRRADLRHRHHDDGRPGPPQLGTDEQKAEILRAGAAAARSSSASASPSPSRAPTSPRRRRRPCATATSGSSTGRRCSRPTPTSATTCSSWPARTPTSPSTRA